MKKNTIFLVVILLVVGVLLGFNYFFEPFRSADDAQNTTPETVTPQKAEKEQNAVETIFGRFDEEDRVGHLLAWPVVINDEGGIEDQDLTEEVYLDVLSKKNLGFFTVFGTQISTTSAKVTIEKLRNHNGSVLPPWIAVDHEGGSVQRFSGEGFTRLASWNSLCDLEQQKMEQLLAKSAIELKSVGVDIVLAPIVDIGPPTSFLKNRVCSANPDTVVDKANRFITAFQDQGILPVLKHFPGIGRITVDLHDRYAVGRVGVEDVFVYRTLLDLYPEIGVMTSHIGLDNQFADIPCSLSKDCVGELIANYQKTLVFSDALEMKSAFYIPESSKSADFIEPTLGEISKKAILAGNNVLIYGPSVDIEQLSEVYAMLVREYLADAQFRQRVDASVKKIISYKLGLPVEDENKYPAIKQN